MASHNAGRETDIVGGVGGRLTQLSVFKGTAKEGGEQNVHSHFIEHKPTILQANYYTTCIGDVESVLLFGQSREELIVLLQSTCKLLQIPDFPVQLRIVERDVCVQDIVLMILLICPSSFSGLLPTLSFLHISLPSRIISSRNGRLSLWCLGASFQALSWDRDLSLYESTFNFVVSSSSWAIFLPPLPSRSTGRKLL